MDAPPAHVAEPLPRWVKALAIVGLLLIIAFVALHLPGGGVGNHGP
ncbi:MAG TPA: hypothetical protein VNZ52_06720 [Candidatus Thermoplasmatota archaeon]|nr:hypothetical protein [Candidatus Thermoplasmatota archaeon]